MSAEPAVVDVGGEYGGVNVAQALDIDTNVVLVEPKDAFVHGVASLCALVDPRTRADPFVLSAGRRDRSS